MYSCVMRSNIFFTNLKFIHPDNVAIRPVARLCEHGANVVPNLVIHRCWYVFGSSQNKRLHNVLSQRCGDINTTL